MKKNNKGFTLAELLIVVAVIAVLVAVAIPTFGDQLEKSRQSTDIQTIRAAYSAASMAAVDNVVDGVAIKSVKDGTKSTKVYYFNAGSGKLMEAPDLSAIADADIPNNPKVASAAKIQAQAKVLKLADSNTVRYSYDDTSGVRHTTGNATTPMWYNLAVDFSKAVLKVTFTETGVDTFDFDVTSVTFSNPKSKTFTFVDPAALTINTSSASDADAVTALFTSSYTLAPPSADTYGTLTYSASGLPSWLTLSADGTFTASSVPSAAEATSYTITVSDDDGGSGTYSITITVT